MRKPSKRWGQKHWKTTFSFFSGRNLIIRSFEIPHSIWKLHKDFKSVFVFKFRQKTKKFTPKWQKPLFEKRVQTWKGRRNPGLPSWLFLNMGNWEGVWLQQACVMCPTPKIPSSRGVTGAGIVCGEDCMWHSVVSRCDVGEKQWIFFSGSMLCFYCTVYSVLLHCKRCTVEFPLGLEARRHMAELVSCFI